MSHEIAKSEIVIADALAERAKFVGWRSLGLSDPELTEHDLTRMGVINAIANARDRGDEIVPPLDDRLDDAVSDCIEVVNRLLGE